MYPGRGNILNMENVALAELQQLEYSPRSLVQRINRGFYKGAVGTLTVVGNVVTTASTALLGAARSPVVRGVGTVLFDVSVEVLLYMVLGVCSVLITVIAHAGEINQAAAAGGGGKDQQQQPRGDAKDLPAGGDGATREPSRPNSAPAQKGRKEMEGASSKH